MQDTLGSARLTTTWLYTRTWRCRSSQQRLPAWQGCRARSSRSRMQPFSALVGQHCDEQMSIRTERLSMVDRTHVAEFMTCERAYNTDSSIGQHHVGTPQGQKLAVPVGCQCCADRNTPSGWVCNVPGKGLQAPAD